MPASEVAIVNRALSYLGAKAVISLDDGTANADRMKAQLPDTRDAVLRSYPWNCATRRVLLPALAAAPAFEFARAFQLPSDCLRVLATEDDVLHDVKWRVEGREILTDADAPLALRYIARITDPSLLDAMLADAISARLAADLAFSITQNATLVTSMAQLAENLHLRARRMDAREASQDEEVTADLWRHARF